MLLICFVLFYCIHFFFSRQPVRSLFFPTQSFDDSRKIKPILAGPFGGPGGNNWDDGVYSTIRQLVICHGAGIDSIKIQYDVKGSSIWSDRHGGNGGTKTDTVAPYFVGSSIVCSIISRHFKSCTSLK